MIPRYNSVRVCMFGGGHNQHKALTIDELMNEMNAANMLVLLPTSLTFHMLDVVVQFNGAEQQIVSFFCQSQIATLFACNGIKPNLH